VARSFTTDSRDGDARAPGALTRLLRFRGLPSHAARAEQIHDRRVVIVPKLRKSVTVAQADGLLTDASGQPLAIFTADCVPIFLTAGQERVVGLLHAGWRGVQRNILQAAIRRIRKTWGIRASEVEIWAGPSIGPCCFKVRWDVARFFPQARRRAGGQWTVDLVAAIKAQAGRLGAHWGSQKPANGCTMHNKRYFSYRRDQTTKRQVSIIMKRD